MSFAIPPDILAAQDRLSNIESIVTASQWERAGIIFAFAARQQGKRSGKKEYLTIEEFAALNIVGLASERTVRHYYDAWGQAVADGLAKPTTPGGSFEVPSIPFPSRVDADLGRGMDPDRRKALMAFAQQHGMTSGAKAVDIANNPKSVRLAILADEETAEVVKQALVERGLPAQPAPAPRPSEPLTARQKITIAREVLQDHTMAKQVLNDSATRNAANVAGHAAFTEEFDALKRDNDLADPEQARKDEAAKEKSRGVRMGVEFRQLIREAKKNLRNAVTILSEIGTSRDEQQRNDIAEEIAHLIDTAQLLKGMVLNPKTTDEALREILDGGR